MQILGSRITSRRRLLLAAGLFVIQHPFAVWSQPACAAKCQGTTAVYDSSQTLQGYSGAVVYADAFPGADACVSIANAIAYLTSPSGLGATGGGTVDARGITGTVNCTANPLGAVQTPLRLLLGSTKYVMTAPWVVPPNVRIEGLGDASQGYSTILQAAGSVNTVLSFAPSSGLSSAAIRDLAIDCFGIAKIGLQNQAAGNDTKVDGLKIVNCIDTGLEVSTSGAANSGPYRDLVVVPGTLSNATTTCVRIGISNPANPTCDGGGPACFVPGWRGVRGLTCNGIFSPTPMAVGVDAAAGGGELSDIHVERVVTGVRVNGNPNAVTTGLVVRNLHGCALSSCVAPTVINTLLEIAAAPADNSAFSIAMSGLQLQGGGANCLVDDRIQNGYLTDNAVAMYVLGPAQPGHDFWSTNSPLIGGTCP